jgi:hypothetical protein
MTRLGLRRDSYNKSQQQLDAMRRRQQEDMSYGMGIGNLASGYGAQSLNFANQRGQNAWLAANMKSGAALGRAGANAGMIGSALQGFNSQEGMEFSNPFAGMFGPQRPAGSVDGRLTTTQTPYSGVRGSDYYRTY